MRIAIKKTAIWQLALLLLIIFACTQGEDGGSYMRGIDSVHDDGGNDDGGNQEVRNFGFCNYGPVTQYGGGCFRMEHENDCDFEWGHNVDVCPAENNNPQPSSNSVVRSSSSVNNVVRSSSSVNVVRSSSSVYVAPSVQSSSSVASNSGVCTDKSYGAGPSVSHGGQTYSSVKIGCQTWMSKNLNYNAPGVSKCYNNQDSYCNTYGRLYDWETAMSACPSGWHLPSKAEWEQLFNFAETNGNGAASLRATSGWNFNNGQDTYGFAALPGGNGQLLTSAPGGDYTYESNNIGNFWSSTDSYSSSFAYAAQIFSNDLLFMDPKKSGGLHRILSVRCVKD